MKCLITLLLVSTTFCTISPMQQVAVEVFRNVILGQRAAGAAAALTVDHSRIAGYVQSVHNPPPSTLVTATTPANYHLIQALTMQQSPVHYNAYNNHLAQIALAPTVTHTSRVAIAPTLPMALAPESPTLRMAIPQPTSPSMSLEELTHNYLNAQPILGTFQPSFQISNTANPNFSITVSTQPSRYSDLQQSLIQQMEMRQLDSALQQQLIRENPEIAQAYLQQQRNNVELLRNIITKNGSEQIGAIVSINRLDDMECLRPGQLLMKEVRPQLQNLLYDVQGNLKPLDTAERRSEALFIVLPYLKAVAKQHPAFMAEHLAFLKSGADAKLPGFALAYARETGTNGWRDWVGCKISNALPQGHAHSLDRAIEQSKFIKDVAQVKVLCEQQRFAEAEKIINEYKQQARIAGNDTKQWQIAGEAGALRDVYTVYHRQVRNEHDIPYEWTDDPYYHLVKNALENAPASQYMELRQASKNVMRDHQEKLQQLFIGIGAVKQQQSPLVRAIGYELITNGTDVKSKSQILSPLCADHEKAENRTACKVFLNRGLPRDLVVNEQRLKNIEIPQKIENAAYVQQRILFAELAAKEAHSPAEEVCIQRAIAYTMKSCTHGNEFFVLADSINQSLGNVAAEKIVAELPDLSRVSIFIEGGEALQRAAYISALGIDKMVAFSSGVDKESRPEDMRRALNGINNVVGHIEKGEIAKADYWLSHIIEPTIMQGKMTPEIAAQWKAAYGRLENIQAKSNLNAQCGLPNKEKVDIGSSAPACLPIAPERQLEGKGCLPLSEVKEGACLPRIKDIGYAEKLWEQVLQESAEETLEEKAQEMRERGCSWNNNRKLPSFSEEATKEQSANAGESKEIAKEKGSSREQAATQIEAIEKEERNELAKGIKELISQSGKTRELTIEEQKVVEEFIYKVVELGEECGIENVREALEVYRVGITKILTREKLISAIRKLATALKVINSNELYKTFKYDCAHGQKVTLSSIQEAIAGIACIKHKLVQELIRSQHNAEDFIEVNQNENKAWDIKTARSYSLEGEYVFNIEEFGQTLKEGYLGKEGIIIQITELAEDDLQVFYHYLKENFTEIELERTIIVHAEDRAQSRLSSELKDFLRKR